MERPADKIKVVINEETHKNTKNNKTSKTNKNKEKQQKTKNVQTNPGNSRPRWRPGSWFGTDENRRITQTANRANRLAPVINREHVARAAAAIALPAETLPVRMSLGSSGTSTGVAKTYIRDSQDPSRTGSPIYAPIGTRYYFIYRDYLRSAVIYHPNPSAEVAIYDFVFDIGNETTSEFLPMPALSEFDLPVAYLTSNPLADWMPHGLQLYCGQDTNASTGYVWCDAGAVLTWNLSVPLPSLQTTLIRVKRWDGSNVIDEAGLLINFLTGEDTRTMTIVAPGYYRFNVQSSWDTYTLHAKIQWNTETMQHRCVHQFEGLNSVVTSVRVNAVSFLYNNTSSVLTKNGSIAAKQFPKGTDFWDVMANGYDTVASASNAKEHQLKDGLYAFLKPTQPSDFDLLDYHHTGHLTGDLTATHFPIVPVSGILAVVLQFEDGGGSAKYHINHSVEFETDAQFFDVRPPVCSPFDIFQTIETVSNMTAICENPTHVREIRAKILSMIGAASRFIINNGPMMLKVAEFLATSL